MFWSSLLLLPALLSPACLAAPSQEKRAAVNDAVLYAYGTNISGYPVLYQSTGKLTHCPRFKTRKDYSQ